MLSLKSDTNDIREYSQQHHTVYSVTKIQEYIVQVRTYIPRYAD